ncbi:hypothetical protein R0137_00670 [Congregibacter brevis]|uniref:Uncharacterized protein n=1 Tax=Congregibacter brevis TaxID=3081201 RepID=A0ABZ0IDI0_9GAMM|nr:hypothetical protein R0137_00670 [Congregibacter sp. IMCC45268]
MTFGGGTVRVLLTVAISTIMTACGERLILGDGVLAPAAPKQWDTGSPATTVGDFRLFPRASYNITAKLLSKRKYRWDDLAEVAQWDFALGWGALSDEATLRPIKVAQGDRFMFWHLYDSPLDINVVNQSSSNVHLIPANDAILRQISEIPLGAVIQLKGELVDVQFPDQRVIPTSLTRTDTGPGACEILLVSAANVLHPSARESDKSD